MPFGGPFLETPRHEENTQTCVFLVFWTPGVPKWLQTLVFYEGLNTHLSRLKLSAHLYVVIRGLGLPRLPARIAKHDLKLASEWP